MSNNYNHLEYAAKTAAERNHTGIIRAVKEAWRWWNEPPPEPIHIYAPLWRALRAVEEEMNQEKRRESDYIASLRNLLCGYLRVMTDYQVALMLNLTLKQAQQLLKRLPKSQFVVSRVKVRVYPVSLPLVRVHPGDPEPDFRALAGKLASRGLEHEWANVVYASEDLRHAYAGTPIKVGNATLGHDIAVTQVFVTLMDSQPGTFRLWRGEDSLPQFPGIVRPDAMLGSSVVLDYGGQYKASRLREIHNFCQANGYTYEIW